MAIRRGLAEDLYIVLAGFDVERQSATLHVVVNPLVNWIWLGFGVLAFGTIIALLPEQVFAVALARVPEGAATSGLLILLLVAGATHAHAQHQEGVSEGFSCRGRRSSASCRRRSSACAAAAAASAWASAPAAWRRRCAKELAGLVAQGKNREEVYQYFMEKWGSQEPLASPIDKGFNRLAWALPYAVGLLGLGAATAIARPLVALRPADPGRGPGTPIDPALEQRLADELRDLD